MSVALAFRLHRHFLWPPVPDLADGDASHRLARAAGTVQIGYACREDGAWHAFLRWLPLGMTVG